MKHLLIILSVILSFNASAQTTIGGKNSTPEVLGGFKVDSALVLPPYAPFTGKGAATTGRIYVNASDSLPGYMKAGDTKRMLTKWDSGTIYVDVGEVGQANGVASLDVTGVVPSSQLPSVTINGQVFVDTNMAQMLSHGSATAGALSVRADSSNALYVLLQTPSSTRANWHLTQGNGVSAFNGRGGAVVPGSSDYNTDSVREGPGLLRLYFTTARAQTVIAGDTTAGWLTSGSRLRDTSVVLRALIGAAGGLNQVLTSSPNSVRALNIGKAASALPYTSVQLRMNSDSSGLVYVFDSTHARQITLSTFNSVDIGGLTTAGGSAGYSLSAQSGTAHLSIFSGATTINLDPSVGLSLPNTYSFTSTGTVNARRIAGVGSSSVTIGAGAGLGASASVSGSDIGGYIIINTGASGLLSSSPLVTLNFSTTFGTAPTCVLISPGGFTSSQLYNTNRFPYVIQSGITATSFTLTSGGFALNASSTYIFYYAVIK